MNDSLSVEEYEDILEEVWGILRVESLNSALGKTVPEVNNLWKLDRKLQEIMQTIQSHRAGTLAGWLRYTAQWKELLPTWQPLCNAAHATMLTRLPQERVEGFLYGLIPR